MDKNVQDLLKGSLERAAEKLKVARKLFKDGDYNDAVSRAYYCAFHAAQALLLAEGLTAETHRGLLNLFGLLFIKTGKLDPKFGKYLSNLKDDRENGDYSIYSAVDRKAAAIAVREAASFLKATQQYLKKFL